MTKNIHFYFLIAIFLLAAFLRFWQLGQNPPSLYWDEVSLGYNAYSISQTARDEHGRFLPITNFAAFGDYKSPLYVYFDVLPIKIFGLNEFAVRFPSALFGFFTVVVTYFLARLLFNKREIALLATLFLAISPWHLQLSRGAFEANLGTFLSVSAIFIFLKGVRQNPRFLPLAAFLFVLPIYTFNAQKVFIPLLLVTFSLIFLKVLLRNWRVSLLSLFIFLSGVAPLISFQLSREGRLRFQEVSIFNDLEPIEISNRWRAEDGNGLWANLIHNRRVFFSLDFLKHYLDHFKPDYLFFHGDINPRLSVRDEGELYLVDLPFLLLGIYFLISKKSWAALPIFAWLFLSPIPAAVARETPHALRTEHILPTFQLITAFGVYTLYQNLKHVLLKQSYFGLYLFLLAVAFFFYLHNYWVHYPILYSGDWQNGYRQMATYIKDNSDQYDQVFVTPYQGRPYINLLFYLKYPPQKYLENRIIERDYYGFYTVSAFDKFVFSDDYLGQPGKLLVVARPEHQPEGFRFLKMILRKDGSPVFKILEKI